MLTIIFNSKPGRHKQTVNWLYSSLRLKLFSNCTVLLRMQSLSLVNAVRPKQRLHLEARSEMITIVYFIVSSFRRLFPLSKITWTRLCLPFMSVSYVPNSALASALWATSFSRYFAWVRISCWQAVFCKIYAVQAFPERFLSNILRRRVLQPSADSSHVFGYETRTGWVVASAFFATGWLHCSGTMLLRYCARSLEFINDFPSPYTLVVRPLQHCYSF